MQLNLPFTLKLITRDWKNGTLRLFALTLILAVSSISSVNIFTSIVKQQIDHKTATLIGANYIVASPNQMNKQWLNKAAALGLQQSQALTFYSMIGQGEKLKLAHIKAVQANYPLDGNIQVTQDIKGLSQPHNVKIKPGEAWLEALAFENLDLKPGDKIIIGQAEFTVKGLLLSEPEQINNWFNIAPKVMIAWEDLPKTQVILPGSQIKYYWLLSGKKAQIDAINSYLKDQLNEQQKIIRNDISDEDAANTIKQTVDYLHLGTLISLILGCIAVSMASYRYAQNHVKQVALLRCFGATQNQILSIYFISTMLVGVISCLIGLAIGYLVQPLLLAWVKPLLPSIHLSFPIVPAILSIGVVFSTLLLFFITNMLNLRHISAIDILRERHLSGPPMLTTYLLSCLVLLITTYVYIKSWQLVLIVGLFFLIFIFLVYTTLALLRLDFFKKIILPFNWRYGLNNIVRDIKNSSLQIISISLVLVVILTLLLMRISLLDTWKNQIPENSTNYFLANIEFNQIEDIKSTLIKNDVRFSEFYPMVRGRLIAINDKSIKEIFGNKVKSLNSLQRELNLSWSDNVPEGNKIIEGKWFGTNKTTPSVSIEEGLANRLGIKLGDKLTFRITNIEKTVSVKSIRYVNWGNLKPNFYMLFNSNVLGNLPITYIAGIQVPTAQLGLLEQIISNHPNISIIDINSIINKVYNIIKNSTNIINFIMIFGFLIGIVIFILSILNTSELKRQETFILKALGVSKNKLLWIQNSEAIIVGLITGLIASFTALFLTTCISLYILKVPLDIAWYWLPLVPLTTCVLTVALNTFLLSSQYENRSV